MKKYFVFSDIHGNLKPLVTALEEKGFQIENENHILISLGDNFDRGIEKLSVLGFLKYFDKVNRLIMILGNHDQYLLNFLKAKDDGKLNVKYNGLGNTLIEFSDKEANTMEKIRESIISKYPFLISLLEKMKTSFKLGNTIFTHAGYSYVSNSWKVDNFPKNPIFINELNDHQLHVFGHFHAFQLNKYFNQKESNDTFRYKNFIGLDANTVLTKKVNVIVFDELGKEL